MTDSTTTQEYLDNAHGSSAFLRAIRDYVRTDDTKHLEQIPVRDRDYQMRAMVKLSVEEMAESPAANGVFLAAVYEACVENRSVFNPLAGDYARQCVDVAAEVPENQMDSTFLDALRSRDLSDLDISHFWITTTSYLGGRVFQLCSEKVLSEGKEKPAENFILSKNVVAKNIFEEIILDLPDNEILQLLLFYKDASVAYGRLLWRDEWFQALLARDKPETLRRFIDELPVDQHSNRALKWPHITANTKEFDAECIDFCKARGLAYPLIKLDELRGGKHTKLILEICSNDLGDEGVERAQTILAYLAQKDPVLMCQRLANAAPNHNSIAMTTEWGDYYAISLAHWNDGGSEVCLSAPIRLTSIALDTILQSGDDYDHLPEWLADRWNASIGDDFMGEKVRESILAYNPQLIEEQLWATLQLSKKTDRACAVPGLLHVSIENLIEKTKTIATGKTDAKLGAIELLLALGDERAVALLAEINEVKQPAIIKKAVVAALEKLGAGPGLDDPIAEGGSAKDMLAEIEKAKPAQLSKTSVEWVNLESLPALNTHNDGPLSEKAILHIIVKQAKHKTIIPAPDVVPLLQLVDRERSGDFALALLNQWLSSDCHAADKWAMTLAGLLGDRRVLPALTDPIAGWVDASRHKLAEWAAQAVALVPADESLMLLDLLANRYRTKYRNIGKACSAALEQAAYAQGMSIDELADMIVPTLEFDSDYQRELPDTDTKAVLQPDFKITFYNPKTEKETKTAPADLPETAKAELKTLKALIRQTIKGQTARLEQDLVRQRSWSTKRWQELFEVNPFLKSYASRLVWSALDKEGACTNVFRRYPNGLLADAGGDLIELSENDIEVVMLHPLNLQEQSLKEWQDHLTRMKIKPPFAQLGRPIERLEPKLANRKQIGFTNEHRMACGTFRSRAEKRGWIRGSVVDAGGITSYYKAYPGASVWIILLVEDTYIGQDPTDSLRLGDAMFVKADSVEIGSYVYDEPKDSDDPRVMAFNDVPVVVYSESISDLKAIMASK